MGLLCSSSPPTPHPRRLLAGVYGAGRKTHAGPVCRRSLETIVSNLLMSYTPNWQVSVKTCTRCKTEKSEDSFSVRNTKTGQLHSWCLACLNDYSISWARDNPDSRKRTSQKYYSTLSTEQLAQRALDLKINRKNDPVGTKTNKRKHRLKSQYGITPQQWDDMHKAQEGACAICLSVEKLFIDHNHTTDIVRELVCQACNFAIGQARENPTILYSMIAYLAKHK